MNIKDAKVLVTGGNSGIGYATAKLLLSKGAKVVICGRREDAVHTAATEIGAIPIVGDVSVDLDVVRMVAESIQAMGGYNVLINNAGFGYFAPLIETDLGEMERVFGTNVFGAMLCARESAKHFISQLSGNIINISSTAGKAGFPNGTVYSASKFAVTSMTECWRGELRKYNIRVMQVNPSEVQTDFVINSGREARPYNETKLQSSEIAHTIVSMLEMNDRGFITEATVFATNPQ